MGNILATPPTANYRRTLSGANRINAIQKLDNESIDLFYVLYIYFILVLCAITVIYLYSIRAEGVPRFKGDLSQSGQESWWARIISWLQETPADRRCRLNSCPTISIPAENQPSTTQMNSICSPGENGKPDSDCIQ